jgi:DhnA family fructose-bisphosphate aldolase class Ia
MPELKLISGDQMNKVSYRLQEFIRPQDGHSLVVDTSASLWLGTLPGLERFEEGVHTLLSRVDGLVCSPGMLQRLAGLTRDDAGLLVRVDWTNVLRPTDFVLPVTTPQHVPILSAQDALELGASAMVCSFLLGYEEELEADCLYSTVQLALSGRQLGIPLVVDVQPRGPRVSIPDKAIELGASYALESGADVIVVPYPGPKSLETLAAFISVPWLVKPTGLESGAAQMEEALELGGAGLWLDHNLLGLPNPTGFVAPLVEHLHPDVTRAEA